MTDEGRYRLLIEAITDYAIYMLDPTGVVTSWNPGAERLKGYRSTEIVGQHFSKFFLDEDRRAGIPTQILEAAAREGKFEGEGWRVRKDGTRFWVNAVVDPIKDDKGRLLGFAKITRDVTDRMEAQRALEQAREALSQSQKLEAIGQLTGSIAHDFNNLLTAILGSLELLRKRLPDDAKTLSLLDNAIHGAQRGAVLTQRMLAFARRQELRLEPVDVPALVRGMLDLLRRSLGPTVTVKTRFPPHLDAVRADTNQLEMALLNLAVNARDAMPEGGSITIAAREEFLRDSSIKLPPGRYACLSVTDTGEGMDEAVLLKAMEPFFTTKGTGKGTGLGLSVVHGVAEQSGGRLILKSRKGKGTTADLWLPFAEGADQDSAVNVQERHASPFRTHPLVILAVDDDELVLMNTTAMLEDLGHTVLEAGSGKRALDIFAQEPGIDLMITDQAMPHMTGLQLADLIRAQRPDLPIVLATGYAEFPPNSSVDVSRLAKPFWQHELANAITQAVQAKTRGSVLRFQKPPRNR